MTVPSCLVSLDDNVDIYDHHMLFSRWYKYHHLEVNDVLQHNNGSELNISYTSINYI